MMKRICIAILAWAMAPALSVAGGSVGLADIDPLLRQKPALREFLASSLKLDDTAMAAIRFGPHVKHLGGARMGPYTIQAHPKTSRNAAPIEIVLCTDARFFDSSGQAVQDETNAVRLEEKLTVVMLREINSAPASPNCP